MTEAKLLQKNVIQFDSIKCKSLRKSTKHKTRRQANWRKSLQRLAERGLTILTNKEFLTIKIFHLKIGKWHKTIYEEMTQMAKNIQTYLKSNICSLKHESVFLNINVSKIFKKWTHQMFSNKEGTGQSHCWSKSGQILVFQRKNLAMYM